MIKCWHKPTLRLLHNSNKAQLYTAIHSHIAVAAMHAAQIQSTSCVSAQHVTASQQLDIGLPLITCVAHEPLLCRSDASLVCVLQDARRLLMEMIDDQMERFKLQRKFYLMQQRMVEVSLSACCCSMDLHSLRPACLAAAISACLPTSAAQFHLHTRHCFTVPGLYCAFYLCTLVLLPLK